MSDIDQERLSVLGQPAELPASPDEAVLDTVANPQAGVDYIVRFTAPEFTSYRNHGAFHEECTVEIAQRLIDAMTPKWLRIGGYWYPRGGIPIDVFYQTGAPPPDLWIPDQGVAPYRGRG
jgi:7-cyano-7-deazaguanine reductase